MCSATSRIHITHTICSRAGLFILQFAFSIFIDWKWFIEKGEYDFCLRPMNTILDIITCSAHETRLYSRTTYPHMPIYIPNSTEFYE